MFSDDSDVCERIDHLIRDWIRPALVAAAVPVTLTKWEVPDEPVPFADAVAHDFVPTAPGDPWSHPWGTTWFHLTGIVPPTWSSSFLTVTDEGEAQVSASAPNHLRTEVVLDLGFSTAQVGFQAEGTVYRPDGTVVIGLEPMSHYIPLPAHLAPGDLFEFYIEAAANPEVLAVDWVTPSKMGDKATAGTVPIYTLRTAELRRIDTEVEALAADLDVIRGWAAVLPADSTRHAVLIRAMRAALNTLDPEDIAGSARATRDVLAPAFLAPASPSSTEAYAVGHAHIDSAWLWPLRETRRKVARTFSNALRLMEEDSEFVFAASSAQQYEWLRRDHPDVFAEIQQRVAEGRWVIVGGEWVESDAYITGGEALLRQFTEGMRYFHKHFGVRPRTVWLPDSFGYSAALPGIARHVGMTWMLTQKLSWNETDVFPHSTFDWEGIDGSTLFTHFPPVDSYNAELTAEELHRSETNFKDRGVGIGAPQDGGRPQGAGVTLVPFGYGDGGGGPTREMLWRAHRQRDLEGSPRVRLAGPEAFFERAETLARENITRAGRDGMSVPLAAAGVPVWLGELYLENHRGTLTSQHRTKHGNRRNEHLLVEAEQWAAAAFLRTGAPYPYDALQDCWRTVLLLQFHDILPGSSIAWVHREAEAMHADIAACLEALIANSLRALAGSGSGMLLANPGPFPVRGVPGGGAVTLDEGAPDGQDVPVSIGLDGTGWILDNGLLRVHVRSDALIDSVVDLARDREIVPTGQMLGALHVHRDIPNNWDAWNIDADHKLHDHLLTQVQGVEVSSVAGGGALVHVERQDGHSTYTQEITLPAGRARLEFRTDVDWHERRRALRLAFPLDLRTDHAESEIQFGYLTRPIHANTSWDAARFETAAQRWVRVEEGSFGVAVANDQTYGHGISRERTAEGMPYTLVSEALLRSPMAPDPDADQGPQQGIQTTLIIGASVEDAIREGYRINAPVRTVEGVAAGGRIEPLVSVIDGSAVIEAVKLADDRSGDLIVRLYEALGDQTRAVLQLDPALVSSGAWLDATSAVLTDALEEPLLAGGGETPGTRSIDLAVSSDGRIEVALTPFQIRTVRVRGEVLIH
ncbi:MAG: glycosyl hydrolase-related protein [Actinomyces sp.]|nr:glycoside hydrolase family 38 C-terminal domain-containing protein [Actinomyces sp.]MCI1787420.1 glycosyl hydrolase-related protein [Actinomyces sp.]MCI1830762.1 glycosyl hydrolase-related protein [Actinomyces sp.]